MSQIGESKKRLRDRRQKMLQIVMKGRLLLKRPIQTVTQEMRWSAWKRMTFKQTMENNYRWLLFPPVNMGKRSVVS